MDVLKSLPTSHTSSSWGVGELQGAFQNSSLFRSTGSPTTSESATSSGVGGTSEGRGFEAVDAAARHFGQASPRPAYGSPHFGQSPALRLRVGRAARRLAPSVVP